MTTVVRDRGQILASTRTWTSQVTVVAARSFGSYFGSMSTYPVLLGFYLLVGSLYRDFVLSVRVADLAPFLEQLFFLLLLVTPVLCMRSVGEGLRNGAVDLLYVRDVRPSVILFANYIAATAFALLALVVPVAMSVIVVMALGDPDTGQLSSQVLGLVLVTFMLCALSVGASAAVTNSLVGAVLGVVAGLFLWFSGGFGGEGLHDVFALRPHLAGFTSGELALADVIYLSALSGSGLAVGVAALRIRRG